MTTWALHSARVEPVLRPRQAAEILGVSYWTLLRYIRAGVLPAARIRNRLYIRQSAVDALLNAAAKPRP